MNSNQRASSKMRRIPLSAIWLLIGFLLLPFTAWQTVLPLAAWLAPVFLLRFVRTAARARVALPLIFITYAVGNFIAIRGVKWSGLFDLLVWLTAIPLARGIMYTLPYAADRFIGGRLQGWPRLFIFPLVFTTSDWLMSLNNLLTTAGSPAYAQVDNLALMQLVSITGIWGVTFLVMWFASTANELWAHNFDARPIRAKVSLYAGVLLAVILFGSIRLNFTAPTATTVEAATITVDHTVLDAASNSVDWTTFNRSSNAERAAARPKFQATVDQLLTRTKTALRGGAKLIGWQEAAALILAEDKPNILERAGALARRYDAYIQISLLVATRAETWPYLHNQSILLDNTGHVVWTYDKTHPVEGGEAFVVVAGAGKLPFVATPYGRLSTAICNDMSFPALIRQAGQHGVDMMITPYAEIPPIDSSAAAVARAIENGFALVRPTGNGLSLLIDDEGRVLGSQNYFTDHSGVMLTSVPTHGVTTVYSRIGDVFIYLCVIGLILLTGWTFVHGRDVAVITRHQPA